MELSQNPTCIGTGLVALDVVVSGSLVKDAEFLAGGSCGNVLTILSYLGWSTFPIARLSNNIATELLLEDLSRWSVNDDLLTVSEDGSTPVIIHRITKDKAGLPKHKFEFKNPEDGKHLPAYKPARAKDSQEIFSKQPKSNVFYFDRLNRGAIDLAKLYKNSGSLIFFEPSSLKDPKRFDECMHIADVVKFSDDRILDFDQLYPMAIAGLEIQTLGKKGLKYRRRGQIDWIFIAGFEIDNVVDAAGAGDWCTAAIIYHLFKNRSLTDVSLSEIEYALRFGQALSAMNCTFEGARGMMYYIKRSELIYSIEHYVSSNTIKIAQRNATDSVKQQMPQMTITSLLTKV